jgi:hypothetical protein
MAFLVTGFVSSHQLVVTIPAADIAQPGMVLVFVFNPANGNTTSFSGAIGNTSVSGCAAKDSNAVVFTINPIPADQGVSKKIAAVDRQHELIATSEFAAWRDGAYKRPRAESAG